MWFGSHSYRCDDWVGVVGNIWTTCICGCTHNPGHPWHTVVLFQLDTTIWSRWPTQIVGVFSEPHTCIQVGTSVGHSTLRLVVASKTHQAPWAWTLFSPDHPYIVLEMVLPWSSFSGNQNQLLVLCVQWQQFPETLPQPAIELWQSRERGGWKENKTKKDICSDVDHLSHYVVTTNPSL